MWANRRIKNNCGWVILTEWSGFGYVEATRKARQEPLAATHCTRPSNGWNPSNDEPSNAKPHSYGGDASYAWLATLASFSRWVNMTAQRLAAAASRCKNREMNQLFGPGEMATVRGRCNRNQYSTKSTPYKLNLSQTQFFRICTR